LSGAVSVNRGKPHHRRARVARAVTQVHADGPASATGADIAQFSRLLNLVTEKTLFTIANAA
jgi:hypothetical protein